VVSQIYYSAHLPFTAGTFAHFEVDNGLTAPN